MRKSILLKNTLFFALFCLSTIEIGAWSTAETISDQSNNQDFSLVVDDNGNAVVVWVSGDYPYTAIQSTTYISGVWSAPTPLTGIGIYSSPKVAVDPLGNTVAVWEHFSGGNQHIEASKMIFEDSWSTPTIISAAGHNESPHVAIDGLSNVFVTWASRTDDTIVVCRMPNFDSWIPLEYLAANGGNFFPRITANSNGNAMSIWYNQQLDSSFTSTYTNGVWGTPALINQSNTYQSIDKQLSLDTNGNAVTVWNYSETGSILAAVKPFGGDWSEISDVISTDYPNSEPHIAVNTSGNAFAVWVNYNEISVETANFDGSSWSSPATISNTLGNQDVQITTDNLGNATAIWQSWDGGSIQTANFTTGGSYWSYPPLEISSQDFYNTRPQINSNGSGLTVAVWISSDGVYNTLQASTN